MDKKHTRNLGLTALVGLFAFYGVTTHNLRIDSVSTSGLVIKYSKRGLASNRLSCKRVEVDLTDKEETRGLTEDCYHRVESHSLDSGDVEYKVTAYYKGHTSQGTKVFPKPEVENDENHNKDFIISHVVKSKAKFDKADEQAQLAAAIEEEETEVEVAETEESKDDASTAPKVTPPNSTSAVADTDEEANTADLDEETLNESIEAYGSLKLKYATCTMEKSENKKFKKLTRSYERGLRKYITLVNRYEEAGNYERKSPFEKLSTRNKEKLADFVDEIDSLSGGSDIDFDEDSSDEPLSDKERLSCLLERSKEITDKEAQFDHYATYIQNYTQASLLVDSQEEYTAAIDSIESNENFVGILKDNPHIRSSFYADTFNGVARIELAENQKAVNVAQSLSEPLKSQTLKSLSQRKKAIELQLKSRLTTVAGNNPVIAEHIELSSQFWSERGGAFSATSVVSDNVVSGDTDISSANHLSDQQKARLQAMMQRMVEARGSGSARRAQPKHRGTFNLDTKKYDGVSVPNLGDAID